jgi:hypothetical protein
LLGDEVQQSCLIRPIQLPDLVQIEGRRTVRNLSTRSSAILYHSLAIRRAEIASRPKSRLIGRLPARDDIDQAAIALRWRFLAPTPYIVDSVSTEILN